jgi:hypothetical protein
MTVVTLHYERSETDADALLTGLVNANVITP